MRTMCVGLVVALNIGVDPPDLLKTDPCARQECWIGVSK
jgi:regulator-associated protein of mTOR